MRRNRRTGPFEQADKARKVFRECQEVTQSRIQASPSYHCIGHSRGTLKAIWNRRAIDTIYLLILEARG